MLRPKYHASSAIKPPFPNTATLQGNTVRINLILLLLYKLQVISTMSRIQDVILNRTAFLINIVSESKDLKHKANGPKPAVLNSLCCECVFVWMHANVLVCVGGIQRQNNVFLDHLKRAQNSSEHLNTTDHRKRLKPTKRFPQRNVCL